MMRGLFTTLLQKAKDVYTTKIRLCKRKVCEGSQGGHLVKNLMDLNVDIQSWQSPEYVPLPEPRPPVLL